MADQALTTTETSPLAGDQPSSGQLRGLASPSQSPLTASLQGVTPAAAKMAGTPNRRTSALKQAVSGVAEERQQQALEQAATQTEDVQARKTADTLQRLPEVAKLVNKNIFEKMKAAGSPFAAEKAIIWEPGTPLAIQDAIRKVSEPGASPADMEALRVALGKKPTDPVTAADLSKYVSDKSAVDVVTAWGKTLSQPIGALMTLEQLQSLGFANEQAFTQATGKPLKEATWNDFESYASREKSKAFENVDELRKIIADQSQSPQAKQIAQEQLRKLGYSGTLSQEQRVNDVQAQIAAGDSIQVGGQSFSVDELTSDPKFLSVVQRALTEPAFLAELEKDTQNKAFVKWLGDNAVGLQPYLKGAEKDLAAYSEKQAAYAKTLEKTKGFEDTFRALGIDLEGDDFIDLSKLQGVAGLLYSELQKGATGKGQMLGNILNTWAGKTDAAGKSMYNIMKNNPDEMSFILNSADPLSTAQAYQDTIQNQPIYAKAAQSVYTKQGKFWRKDPAIESQRMNLATTLLGDKSSYMSALNEPAFAKYVNNAKDTLRPEDRIALDSRDSLVQHLNTLAQFASNPNTSAQARIDAQARINEVKKAMSALNPNSTELQAVKQAADDVKFETGKNTFVTRPDYKDAILRVNRALDLLGQNAKVVGQRSKQVGNSGIGGGGQEGRWGGDSFQTIENRFEDSRQQVEKLKPLVAQLINDIDARTNPKVKQLVDELQSKYTQAMNNLTQTQTLWDKNYAGEA